MDILIASTIILVHHSLPSCVNSGSEDGRSYLWEKNHNTCLGTLQHTEGVVNGVAFCPVDQETCVTVCDDKLIKVWRSRHRKQQIEKKKA